MEKKVSRYRILDYREFKKNYKGEYKDYIIKESKQNKLYKLEELNIIELIKKQKIEYKEMIEVEGKYIEYIFEGINLKIILSIPGTITEEYVYQKNQITKYLEEIKQTIKETEKEAKKQTKEKLKYIRNVLIASGIGSLILFKVEDNIEKRKQEKPDIRPKVVYETPTYEEKDPINIMRRTRI